MYYTCSACNLIIHGELVPLIHFGFWNVPGITGTCVRIQWNETPERLEPNTGPVGNCRRNTQLTDITEIPCSDAKLYLAPILDCYDGSILGFKMDTHMKAELCVEAYENACVATGARGMILHSDRGSQFTSQLFRKSLANHGAVQSMSGVGRCYDNARMESFFATLKKEKLYQMDTTKLTSEEVKSIVFRYIYYYNLRRIYSTNGGWPPLVYRQYYYNKQKAA